MQEDSAHELNSEHTKATACSAGGPGSEIVDHRREPTKSADTSTVRGSLAGHARVLVPVW